MSHTPGYWRSSGRVPPTGRHGRRPTTTARGCLVAGSLLLAVLGIGLLGVLARLLQVNALALITFVGLVGAGSTVLIGLGRRVRRVAVPHAKRKRHHP